MLTSMGFAIIAFILYWGIVETLRRKGVLEKYEITAYGPILLIRTKKGLNLLERISKARTFWKIYANIGLPAVFAGMVFMFALILVADYIMLTSPPQPSELTSPRAALLLPGVNPFIPVIWGTIGLIVTLVVHEFSHAILCRVEGVRVKALGVILALVPIGGFAEPDEKELLDKERTSASSRVRIFSAGVISNFIVAFIVFVLFFQLIGAVNPSVVAFNDTGNFEGKVVELNGYKVTTPEEVRKALGNGSKVTFKLEKDGEFKLVEVPNVMGVKITGLYRENNKTFPAERAGIKAGMLIVRIDNTTIRDYKDFQRKMGETKPGERITVYVYDSGSIKSFNVTLAGKDGKGFLGVYVQTFDSIDGINLLYSSVLLEEIRSIPKHIKSVQGWLYLIAMPFRFQGFTGDYNMLFDAPPWFFWVLNTLYWVGWINFYVGLFNCLPAIPLDGGRVFHEVFSRILVRRYGERGEEISMQIVKVFAFIVFFSILLSIAIPNLEGLI
ncbi:MULTISPECIES: site-2 protease family protein [unclassified Archaeoglobus]|uniref:site-2 protease family protein n=1 Tax=unclassified Archaeoglobus TaxID=2643606 RepID=UPI0025C32330|nr:MULTISPECIES: site-2 protease family protein [unclassified Archaeoglobus]